MQIFSSGTHIHSRVDLAKWNAVVYLGMPIRTFGFLK